MIFRVCFASHSVYYVFSTKVWFCHMENPYYEYKNKMKSMQNKNWNILISKQYRLYSFKCRKYLDMCFLFKILHIIISPDIIRLIYFFIPSRNYLIFKNWSTRHAQNIHLNGLIYYSIHFIRISCINFKRSIKNLMNRSHDLLTTLPGAFF